MRGFKSVVVLGLVASMASGHSVWAAQSSLIKLPDAPLISDEDEDSASSWNGIYIGGSLGLFSQRQSWTTTSLGQPASTNASVYNSANANAPFGALNGRASAHLGFNVQIQDSYVAGLEFEVGLPRDKAHHTQGIPGTYGALTPLSSINLVDRITRQTHWDGSIRGRFGYLAAPSTLVYASAGFAFMGQSTNLECPALSPTSSFCSSARQQSFSQTRKGWTAGFGVESNLGESAWSARIEYRYSRFQPLDQTFFDGSAKEAVTAHQGLTTHMVTMGLNYSFADLLTP
ncbi:MAG: porin family protein [Alphaproteobacteria bacterium]|nr:porin family protein [Alphaproteobacteria bacterium]